MIKVLIDTNVILDAIAAREPFREYAEKIVLLAAEERITGCITANSVTDIYYIAQKSLSDQDARGALRYLFQIFSVIDLNGEDCEAALDLPTKDYEDAVMMICGHKIQADYIITRDKLFLEIIDVISVVSPTSFLELYSHQQEQYAE